MQIDQTNIQKDIDRKIAENAQGIFAYIKEDAKASVATTEQYKKSEEASSSGSISMSDATYMRPEHEKEKKNPAQQHVKEGN